MDSRRGCGFEASGTLKSRALQKNENEDIFIFLAFPRAGLARQSCQLADWDLR